MSSLKRALDTQRSFAPENPCYSVLDQTPTLSVIAGGHEWIFPWIYFVEAKHTRANAGEILVLLFGRSKVMIHGENLTLLGQEIRKMRLDQIRELPREYDHARGNTVINKIIVEPIKKLKKDNPSNNLSDTARIGLASEG